jgi:hypothetical protein
LDRIASSYTITLTEQNLKEKFAELIVALGTNFIPVAVIIDEYDKPITSNADDLTKAALIAKELDHFLGTLKGHDVDKNLHFLFITGIHTFSKEVILAGLNNLDDITFTHQAETLVGFTDQEIDSHLTGKITELAKTRNQSYEQTRKLVKQWYGGYRFAYNDTMLYNPYALNNCLTHMTITNYWFLSGPTTLASRELVSANQSTYPIAHYYEFSINRYYQQYSTFLLQEGYFTFTSEYDEKTQSFTIGYPNDDVAKSVKGNAID